MVRGHGLPAAVVVQRGELWWARTVQELVVGVRETPDADFILRRPLVSSAPLSGADRAMVAVAGGRARHVVPEHGALPSLRWRDARPWAASAWGHAEREADWYPVGEPWDLAWAQVARCRREGPAWRQDRPVGAVLCDASGRPLLATRNLGGSNRALHAELSLATLWQRRTGRGLPAGSRLYVTLSPCRMCAAALVAAAVGELEVVYAARDEGRLAQATALDEAGWLRHDPDGGR